MTDLSATEGNSLEYYFARIEHLIQERRNVSATMKAVYDEAAANGFVPRAMRAALNLRAMSTEDRREHEALVMLYAQEAEME